MSHAIAFETLTINQLDHVTGGHIMPPLKPRKDGASRGHLEFNPGAVGNIFSHAVGSAIAGGKKGGLKGIAKGAAIGAGVGLSETFNVVWDKK